MVTLSIKVTLCAWDLCRLLIGYVGIYIGHLICLKTIPASVRQPEIAEITPSSVTQGKTSSNDEKCCAAAHAVDRDLSTIASTAVGEPWLKLEFDRPYFIHKIVTYYRFYTNWFHPNSWCVQSEDRFRECTNTDNNVDVSVYQGEVKQKSCGTLQLTYGLEQSDQIYTLICNTEGNTVKFSKTTGRIEVFEVAVTSTGS